jgi:predicted esterase
MTIRGGPITHVHADGRTARAGAPLSQAERAIILVHGRGATPESILSLADELPGELGFAFVAPGASESSTHPRSWYPQSFLAPIAANEPGLSSGLAKIDEAVSDLAEHDVVAENIILLGFSQGACLVSEYAARNARRWGAVVAFTGGVIGDADAPRDYPGAFDGTPTFLGCSDRDPHVPRGRVDETEELFDRMGAQVEKRIYPGLPHTIIRDELDWVEDCMRRLAEGNSRQFREAAAASG